MPDLIQPTSFALTKNFYPNYISIIKAVSKLITLNLKWKNIKNQQNFLHDIPGPWFKGPF